MTNQQVRVCGAGGSRLPILLAAVSCQVMTCSQLNKRVVHLCTGKQAHQPGLLVHQSSGTHTETRCSCQKLPNYVGRRLHCCFSLPFPPSCPPTGHTMQPGAMHAPFCQTCACVDDMHDVCSSLPKTCCLRVQSSAKSCSEHPQGKRSSLTPTQQSAPSYCCNGKGWGV